MEKALDMWQSNKAKIDAGEDPKKLPTRTDIAAFYKIKYKTFCHRINGRTAAKGHASGGARRGRVFTVGMCENSYKRSHQSLYFKHYLKASVLVSMKTDLGPCRTTTSLHRIIFLFGFIIGFTVHIIAI